MRYPGVKHGRDKARPSNDENARCVALFHPIEGLLQQLQVGRLAEF
jgi:hypothetical protein